MNDLLLDLALPRTNAGALAQAAIAVPIFGIAIWRVRHDRDIRTFVARQRPPREGLTVSCRAIGGR
ncbi:MAG: hypothetical protein ABIX10_04160 [Acidimicrobiales bacterium]